MTCFFFFFVMSGSHWPALHRGLNLLFSTVFGIINRARLLSPKRAQYGGLQQFQCLELQVKYGCLNCALDIDKTL